MQPPPSFLQRCLHSAYEGTIALVIGFVIFYLLEKLFFFKRIKKPWRDIALDLKYGFLSFLYPPMIHFILSAVFAVIMLQARRRAQNPAISPIVFAGELLILLFVRDILIYVRHRIFHLKPVWKFHSIHHSSQEVNWLSALRFHPGEEIIESTGEMLLFSFSFAVIGVYPGVLFVAGLIIGFYNLFIHSNLRWTFGPLRYILVSPVFHRWHHSDLPAALDKNFAAMFSCLDLALGTFYMPMNVAPKTTGLSAEEKITHPQTLSGQLLYPFMRARRVDPQPRPLSNNKIARPR